MFFAFLYLEYGSMLTPAIMEGLFYRDFGLFSLPSLVYNGTFNYILAVPILNFLQVFHLGNRFKIFMPLSVVGIWSQKFHMSNFWQFIDMYNPDHFYVWTASLMIFAGMNYGSVCARLIGLSKYKVTPEH